MNLCSGGRNFTHNEVCYDSKDCPVCYLNSELRSEIDNLSSIIESNEERISELERKDV